MENNNTNNNHNSESESHHENHEHHEGHEHNPPHEHDAHNPGEHMNEEAGATMNRSRMIKIAIIAAVVIVVLGLLYSFKSVFVAAIVDGHPISRYTVVKELERASGKDTLDTLIDKQLINNAAKAKNITVSDEDINGEMKKFEDQFSAGGQNLDDALKAENLTREDLKKQIFIRKEIEKLIGDGANISDEEVTAYMTESKVTPPAGQEDAIKGQIKDQLRQQKLAELSTNLLKDLRSKAKIRNFVDYKGGTPTE